MPDKVWLPKNVRDAFKEQSKEKGQPDIPSEVEADPFGNLDKLLEHNLIDQATYNRLKSGEQVPSPTPQVKVKAPAKTLLIKTTHGIADLTLPALPYIPAPASTIEHVHVKPTRLAVCTIINNDHISCTWEDTSGVKTTVNTREIELGYHSRVKANITPGKVTIGNVSKVFGDDCPKDTNMCQVLFFNGIINALSTTSGIHDASKIHNPSLTRHAPSK